MNKNLKKMILSALCLALCMLLPYLTGQIPTIGSALSPMHIPVLLCGFLCGMPWAPIIGFIAPLLRFAIAGMPPLFPTGISMVFELATYGAVSAILYRKLPDKPVSTYVALIGAMFCGRVVWGIARLMLSGLSGSAFTFSMFIAGAFTSAVPGIICHIVLIPALVFALRRAHILEKPSR